MAQVLRRMAVWHRLAGPCCVWTAALAACTAGAQTTTGSASAGATLYNTYCDNCHGTAPGETVLKPIRNAANAGGVINRAMVNGMGGFTGGSFTATQENNLAAFIAAYTPTPNPEDLLVPHDSPGVSFTLPDIYLDSYYGGFASILLVTAPSRGAVSFAGKVATYVPAPGAYGADSFTWRAIGAPGDTAFTSNLRTVTLSIAPLPPVITSPTTQQAKVGVPLTYYIFTTGGAPDGYAAVPLPAGLVLTGNAISGTPQLATVTPFTTNVHASNAGGVATIALAWTIDKGDQLITFPAQVPITWPILSFGILPATTNALLPVTYTSATPEVCTVVGSTAIPLTAGVCTVAANQPGNPNWNAAAEVRRDVLINKGGQFINFNAQSPATRAYVQAGTFAINPLANVFSGLTITYGTVTPAVCSVSDTTVTMLAAGTCTISAAQPGDVNYYPASTILRSVGITAQLPKAPVIDSATGANAGALIGFTAPQDTGGAPVLDATATCTAAGQATRSATAAASPITVSSLVNGVAYTCTVRVRNSVGLGPASAGATVTPMALAFTGVVVSRKVHGGIARDIGIDAGVPLDGALTIEPRGGTHQLVFVFNGPVTVAGNASVLYAGGQPAGSATTLAQGSSVLVTLSGIAAAARVTVALAGVNGAAGASTAIGFLPGDVSGNGQVTAGDLSAVKARAGLDIALADHWHFDLNLDGVIDAKDLAVAKARAGTVLP